MNRPMTRCVTSCVAIFFVTFSQLSTQSDELLPVGSHPAALDTPHFPDRLHTFVWRNWQLVEPRRLAKVVGTTTENIVAIAESMGLPVSKTMGSQMHERGYITVLRRNWHLLPYDQLLTLLEMTSEELAFSLREDDGVFWKLGDLKPKCERLQYSKPDSQT